MSKPNPIIPWTYSKMHAFDTCAKQFYHMKVAKDYKESFSSTAIEYGNEFHKAAELYVSRDEPLKKKFAYTEKSLQALKSKRGIKKCEYKMGLTANLKKCGFFDKDVWWRGVGDLIILNGTNASVVDYKTGKSAAYADTDQLELMALGLFVHFPDIQYVRAGLLFVVPKKFIKASYSRDDVPELWSKWLNKVARMEAAYENNVWNPSPSGLCYKHCEVTECPHNGRN